MGAYKRLAIMSAGALIRTTLNAIQVTTDQRVRSMREEVWVASPEAAVGVFTADGTCQGRLRRHFVIGCAAP
jgi:hypothetical protein